jgi:hypothetical protein
MTDKRVGILIFPDVEALDFCGPYEVFSVTRLDEERRREESSPFEVLLVAQRAEPVMATEACGSFPTSRSRPVRHSTSSSCPAAGERAQRSATSGLSSAIHIGYVPIAVPGWDVRREDFEKAPGYTYFALGRNTVN